jgi:Uncharacterized anaerobic dehydrogenase
LRGHASIQGSTDVPTLYNILPGYIAMRHAHSGFGLQDFIQNTGDKYGYWGHLDAYLISLLKAWWGDNATSANEYCFDYLPRLTGDHSAYVSTLRAIDGELEGYFLIGENPAVGNANGKAHRMALANLKWLVVRDFQEIESASFWHDSPEIETGELRTADIGTEVFFLPAAAHTEKDGTFTNTQRMLQWHHKASSRRATPARTCGSPTTWAGASGRSWPARSTRRTSRSWSSRGTTPPKAATGSPPPTPC